MNTAVIVLTWNDWKNTIDCLQSISKNNLEKYDVILIDNGSKFNHISNIKKWFKKETISNNKFIKPDTINFKNFIDVSSNFKISNKLISKKNIFFIRNKINYGLTKGINIGFKFAINNRYKYIVRVDNDYILEKDSLKRMIQTLKTNNIIAVSPKILHAYLKKTVWWSGFKMNWKYLKFHQTMNLQKKRISDSDALSKILSVDTIVGSCSAYKTSALIKSGLGDEEFFYGPEDQELSYRLKSHGTLVVNQKAIAYHKIARSSVITKKENRVFQSTYGFLLLIKKTGTFSDKIIGYTYFVLRLFYYLIFNYEKKIIEGYSRALRKFFFV